MSKLGVLALVLALYLAFELGAVALTSLTGRTYGAVRRLVIMAAAVGLCVVLVLLAQPDAA